MKCRPVHFTCRFLQQCCSLLSREAVLQQCHHYTCLQVKVCERQSSVFYPINNVRLRVLHAMHEVMQARWDAHEDSRRPTFITNTCRGIMYVCTVSRLVECDVPSFSRPLSIGFHRCTYVEEASVERSKEDLHGDEAKE